MRTVPALTERGPTERWREVRDEEELWGDLRPELPEAVKGSARHVCQRRRLTTHRRSSLTASRGRAGETMTGVSLRLAAGGGRRRPQRRVVLAVYGIAADGRRELLDYRQVASESTAGVGGAC